jgi:hypothetical protein
LLLPNQSRQQVKAKDGWEGKGGKGRVWWVGVYTKEGNDPEDMRPRLVDDGGKQNLKQGEGSVQSVFADIGPCGILCGKSAAAGQQTPIDDSDDDGEGDDGGKEDCVGELEGPIPSIEGGSSGEGVDEGMKGSEEEVEREGNVGNVGEITKV